MTDVSFFQSPFNVLSYQLLGDVADKNYFSIAADGNVTLRSSVNDDKSTVYTVSIRILLTV